MMLPSRDLSIGLEGSVGYCLERETERLGQGGSRRMKSNFVLGESGGMGHLVVCLSVCMGTAMEERMNVLSGGIVKDIDSCGGVGVFWVLRA